jgi:hypothetical protein
LSEIIDIPFLEVVEADGEYYLDRLVRLKRTMQYHRQSPRKRHLGLETSITVTHTVTLTKYPRRHYSHTQLLSINFHGQEKEQTGKDFFQV